MIAGSTVQPDCPRGWRKLQHLTINKKKMNFNHIAFEVDDFERRELVVALSGIKL